MANKITKREIINTMLADENIKGNEMYVTYLEHELELLNKKAEKRGKSDEELAEIARLKSLITDTLATVGKGTVSEIQKANSELGDLKEEGVVIRATEGRKTIFYLA